MIIRTICLTSALLGFSAFGHAADNTPANSELVEAHRVIEAYRELRESCAEGSYEERRACVNKLSKASAEYREAKDIISQARLSTATNNTLAAYN